MQNNLRSLNNRVALISGCGSDFGESLARQLASAGMKLMLTDQDARVSRTLSNAIGSSAFALQHDISSESSWIQVLETITNSLGRLDLLVNISGIPANGEITSVTFSHWREIMTLNTDAVFLGCKHALPVMEASGGGMIINTVQAEPSDAGSLFHACEQSLLALGNHVSRYCQQRNNRICCETLSLQPPLEDTAADLVKRLAKTYT